MEKAKVLMSSFGMDKAKFLMLGSFVGIVLLLVVTVQPEVAGTLITSNEKLRCPTGPGWSDNPPYSKLNQLYRWWINVTITSKVDCWNVEISNQFGQEFKVEGITVGNPQKQVPTYILVYGDYEPGGSVSVTKDDATDYATGLLNKDGITFDGWHIYWVGESLEAYVEWKIGNLGAGETVTVFFTVSTDTNPSGEQEFTSYGTYYLDSGVTINGEASYWWIINGQIDSKVDGIEIEVTEA